MAKAKEDEERGCGVSAVGALFISSARGIHCTVHRDRALAHRGAWEREKARAVCWGELCD